MGFRFFSASRRLKDLEIVRRKRERVSAFDGPDEGEHLARLEGDFILNFDINQELHRLRSAPFLRRRVVIEADAVTGV